MAQKGSRTQVRAHSTTLSPVGASQLPYLQYFIVCVLHGYVEGGHHVVILEVWVGSSAQKKLNTFHLVFLCGPVQRGISIVIHHIQHYK